MDQKTPDKDKSKKPLNAKLISKNGMICLGKCNVKGKLIYHPIRSSLLTSSLRKEKAFCITDHWLKTVHKNPQRKTVIPNPNRYVDGCVPDPDADTDLTKIDFDYNENIYIFNGNTFLKNTYKISSFDDAFNYISTDTAGTDDTYIRILECAYQAYGYNFDAINENLINFYLRIFKTKWIKYIYPIISHYIMVQGDMIQFERVKSSDKASVKASDKTSDKASDKASDKTSDKASDKTSDKASDKASDKTSDKANDKSTSDTENKVAKINFFFKKMVDNQFIYNFLNKYVETYKSDWDNINSHYDNMIPFAQKYIEKNIIQTIDK